MKTTPKKEKAAPIVISVGGSLIVPDQIDSKFLKSLKALIEKGIKKIRRFRIEMQFNSKLLE